MKISGPDVSTQARTASASFHNFDFIRLVAASSVIFSHSFLIADGNDAREPFVRLLGESNILGLYGVFLFFIVSGFLVTQSACRSRSVLSYAWNRILRIYPALIGCAAFSAVVLGTAFTTISRLHFWLKLIPLDYALNVIEAPGHNAGNMESVVFYPSSGGWLASCVNGSLWTIPLELTCYLIVGVLAALRMLNWRTALAVCALCLPLMFGVFSHLSVATGLSDFLLVAPSFACGAVVYFLWDKWKLPFWPILLCPLAAAAAFKFGRFMGLFPLFAAYPLIWLGTTNVVRLPSLKKFGDISYGVYLYGWPMEQVARAWIGPSGQWWQVFLLGGLLAGACGYASWRLIEGPALKLKQWTPALVRKRGGAQPPAAQPILPVPR
jgi:peptidoglycan/LPS O-acetylase OafA/YrhL